MAAGSDERGFSFLTPNLMARPPLATTWPTVEPFLTRRASLKTYVIEHVDPGMGSNGIATAPAANVAPSRTQRGQYALKRVGVGHL
jgi:hypothetical protein